jgi:membrane protein DedA with SNARE-associated domain
MHPLRSQLGDMVVLMVTIVLSGFLSEDGATITAATLATSSLLDFRLAFVSAIGGLWIGDLGVYFAARCARSGIGRRHWASRLFLGGKVPVPGKAEPSEPWKLAASRFLPGTRLPAYLAAGFGRMPLRLFAVVTAISATLWTLLVFAAIHAAPSSGASGKDRLAALSAIGLSLFGILTVARVWGRRIYRRVSIALSRLTRWEFWPAWIFYTPVALFCGWLGIRFRGLSLPTIANLNQRNGGVVGESKFDILRQLLATSPEATADAYLIEPGPASIRAEQIAEICRDHQISLPFVLKPDTGQRGAGFCKIGSLQEAGEYVSRVSSPVVLQRYMPGPLEAGIFYYRFPQETQGHIFGITRKRFPFVVGDGRSSLKNLIERDPRARIMSAAYFARFGDRVERVPRAGEKIRLVEAGNHCQGCIFEDGSDLYSGSLLRAIDEISQQLPGFYVGRFDIRYERDADLRNGVGFKIIELNGAASEATNIYDPRYSLWRAYAMLHRQWRIVYAIGAANRAAGAPSVKPSTLWRDWYAFSRQACEYPVAD